MSRTWSPYLAGTMVIALPVDPAIELSASKAIRLRSLGCESEHDGLKKVLIGAALAIILFLHTLWPPNYMTGSTARNRGVTSASR